MKAIRIHNHGDSSVLQIDDIAEPEPKSHEVKIKIHASSLNHMDLWVRKGIPGIGELPLILGCDGAGVVESVGEDVTDFQSGDRVVLYPVLSCHECEFCEKGLFNHCRQMKLFGEHVNGTHCEKICVSQQNVLKLSEAIDFESAAAFPLVFLTAWHMLVFNARVRQDKTVLVVGASSGVGSTAIQIAKLHGATVIATAGTSEKLAFAKKLGADHVIHHYEESISARVKEITKKQGVDIIFEHVGEKVWAECLKALKWSGCLVTCGATTGPQVSMDLRHIFIKQQRIQGSTMGTYDEMKTIHDLVAQKKLKPVIAKVFSYKDVMDAHRFLEASQGFGKVILKW